MRLRSAIARIDRVVRSCFFFQAEDGIRDKLVTGVQTCALPISTGRVGQWRMRTGPFRPPGSSGTGSPPLYGKPTDRKSKNGRSWNWADAGSATMEIGRASCRERVEISVGAVSLKKKYRRMIDCQ